MAKKNTRHVKLWIPDKTLTFIWNHKGKVRCFGIALPNGYWEMDRSIESITTSLLKTMSTEAHVGKNTRPHVFIAREKYDRSRDLSSNQLGLFP